MYVCPVAIPAKSAQTAPRPVWAAVWGTLVGFSAWWSARQRPTLMCRLWLVIAAQCSVSRAHSLETPALRVPTLLRFSPTAPVFRPATQAESASTESVWSAPIPVRPAKIPQKLVYLVLEATSAITRVQVYVSKVFTQTLLVKFV